jgi:pimeloyl-ACP methyl ester carboxylesterase
LAEAVRRVAQGANLDDFVEVPLGALGTFYYTPLSLISNGGPNTNSDHLRWLPVIDVPVLVVHATQDTFSFIQQPVLAHEAAVAAPRADLVYIEGADHGFNGRIDELADLVESWMVQALGHS